jgi:hypothetical protein
MTEEIFKRLLIIKDVFSHGEQHAYFDTKIDRRLAIISFHNSIELFLRCALNSKSTSNDKLDGMNFGKKIDEFKIKLMKNKEVPYDLKIRDLNNFRNKIYHDYRIPTKEETEEFKVIARLFLEELTQKIFNLNFEDISLFDLDTVRNPFVRDAYIGGLDQFNAYKYDKSMIHFQNAFNEQFNSIYGDPINIKVNISEPNEDPAIDEIISSIDSLAFDIEVSFKKIQKFIINKHHLELKDWVDTVFHRYSIERVDPDEITKMKKLLEEFIAETDDYILKDYLEYRIREYKSMNSLTKFLK